jgi:decaprenylphospho-beta-D-erythro-pentofuranosid-2-ulose 2-reductase
VRNRVLLVGATSGIGRALARALARRGYEIVLASRSQDELVRMASDLEVRENAKVQCDVFDARNSASHVDLVARCMDSGGFDGVVVCYGTMHDQIEAERDPELAWDMLQVNLLSPIALLEAAALHLAARRKGWLCVVSSVAGDRGRRTNYLYGSSKAGLNAYLEGLEARLAPTGVSVVTIKPGFVDTGLTWGVRVPLAASPERVARDILRGIDRRRSVVYTPGFWRWIMLILRMLPRVVFRRLPI